MEKQRIARNGKVHAYRLRNRQQILVSGKKLYKLRHSETPNVKNLHVFGCKVLAYIPKEKGGKLGD